MSSMVAHSRGSRTRAARGLVPVLLATRLHEEDVYGQGSLVELPGRDERRNCVRERLGLR